MNKTKKIVSLLLSGTIVLGIVTNYRSIVYAQDSDAPILYLEVSNTITAQDSFAWDTYDHINYIEPSYTQLNLPNHIILDGSNIKMMGYGEVAYKDSFLLKMIMIQERSYHSIYKGTVPTGIVWRAADSFLIVLSRTVFLTAFV